MLIFNDRYDPDKDAKAFGTIMLLIAAIICGLVLSALTGCKTQERIQIVEHVRTDTLYQSKVQRDSIHVHDSVYVNQWTAGDTVYVTRDRWHTAIQERIRTDTIYHHCTDSVPVPYPVTKEVPAELTWWQKTRIYLAEIMLCAFAIGVIIYFGRKHIGMLIDRL